MKYYEYFQIFLNIENNLSNYMQTIEYSNKSKTIYTINQSLLLLQTCPIIESFMIDLSIDATTVINHPLYNWKFNWKLYKKKEKENTLKLKDNKRLIESFPKFAYVCEEVFKLSNEKTTFYYTDKLQYLPDNINTETISPFSSLKKFFSYTYFDDENKKFPIGLESPEWWLAYNKIKHDFEKSREKVNYKICIEAISALFIILCYCDPDIELLKKNGFIINRDDSKLIKSKYFSCKISP